MTEMIAEAGKWALGALATVLSFFGVFTFRKVYALQKEKADRSEVSALVDRFDRSHDALLARIDKSNDDASEKREKMYAKIDRLTETVSRYMGQQEGQ